MANKKIDPAKIAKAKSAKPVAGRGAVDRPIRGSEIIFRSANGRPVGNGGSDSPRNSRFRVPGFIAAIVTGRHRKG